MEIAGISIPERQTDVALQRENSSTLEPARSRDCITPLIALRLAVTVKRHHRILTALTFLIKS